MTPAQTRQSLLFCPPSFLNRLLNSLVAFLVTSLVWCSVREEEARPYPDVRPFSSPRPHVWDESSLWLMARATMNTHTRSNAGQQRSHSQTRTSRFDLCVREPLLQAHEAVDAWTACARIFELSDTSDQHLVLASLLLITDQSWIRTSLSTRCAFCLDCASSTEPIVCAACKSGVLGTGAARASSPRPRADITR